MNCRIAILIAVVWFGGTLGLVAGAEDDYLELFNQIQRADQSAGHAAPAEALQQYQDVLTALKAFVHRHPEWHPEVIGFRIRYVTDQVAALAPVGEEAAPEGEEASPTTDSALPEQEQALSAMQARLRQMEVQRVQLEARLREALTARPSAAGSPELQEAEERIRQQQKEIDLLRFSLQERTQTPGPSPDPAVREELESRLQDVSSELQLERTKATALETMVAGLQARLHALEAKTNAPPPPSQPLLPVSADTTAEVGVTRTVDVSAAVAAQGVDDSDVANQAALDSGALDRDFLLLSQAAQADDASAGTLATLGVALADRGLLDAAQAVLERAIALPEDCPEAHLEMVRICLRRSPPARGLARWHYQEARRQGLVAQAELEATLMEAAAADGDRAQAAIVDGG